MACGKNGKHKIGVSGTDKKPKRIVVKKTTSHR